MVTGQNVKKQTKQTKQTKQEMSDLTLCVHNLEKRHEKLFVDNQRLKHRVNKLVRLLKKRDVLISKLQNSEYSGK